ncbi:MAG: hypothetical protein EXS13_09095 [Planctomycetes bacterium]|nr:hypothetical protein [Planctomycetota bacterium]
MIVALLGGGGAWLASERGERTRIETAAGQVRDGLARARELARVAEAEPRHLVAPRELALTAADAALATALAADPGSDLRSQAETLQREVAAATAASRAAAADRLRDQSALAQLTEQIGRWYVAPWDEIDRAVTQVFRDWGLDLATISDEQVIAKVRGSSEPVEFCDHLLAWIKVRYELAQIERVPDDEPREFERLQRIVQTADPDPWRVKLRGAVPDYLEILEQAADDPAIFDQEVRTISHLGSMLISFGMGEKAFPLLERAARLHPDEYVFRYFLAVLVKNSTPRRWELALDHASAAITLAPDMLSAQMMLAVIRDGTGDFDGAVAAADTVLRLDPRSRQAVAGRIWSLIYGGRYAEARASIDAAISGGTPDDKTLHARAVVEMAAGRLADAQATLKSLLANAGALSTVPSAAMSLCLAGDPAGAADAVRVAQRRVNPFVGLELVINLHGARAHALEQQGELDGALAALRQIEQLQSLAEALPDYENGALEPEDPLAAARVALLLARAGANAAAFDLWDDVWGNGASRAAILALEPSLFVSAAGAAATLALDPATGADLRERAVARCHDWVLNEAEEALATQGRDPARSARSRVHILLLQPELRLLRDAALRAALTAPQQERLARLGAELRTLLRLTRG